MRLPRVLWNIVVCRPALICFKIWPPLGHILAICVEPLGIAERKTLHACIILFVVYIALCHKARFPPHVDRGPIIYRVRICGIVHCSFTRERQFRIAWVIRASATTRYSVQVDESVFIISAHESGVTPLA